MVPRPLRRAAVEYLEARRLLERGGINPVGEVLRGHGEFVEMEHYPPDDVYDERSGGQYYYHAHRGLEGEHGHFHLFVRTGRLESCSAWHPSRKHASQPTGEAAIAHLAAVSMDAFGWPIGLFVTNRWVTDETWYTSRDVARLLPRFSVDHAFPSHPVNRALGALLVLFRPEIHALLDRRESAIATWERSHPGIDTLEDRRLDILASVRIDVDERIRKCLGTGHAPGHGGEPHSLARAPAR